MCPLRPVGRAGDPLGHRHRFLIARQLVRDLLQGIAGHQHIIQHAQERDGIWNEIKRGDDVEERNDHRDLFSTLKLKGGITEHLVGQLYIIQRRFPRLAFDREGRIPFVSDLFERPRLFRGRSPLTLRENVLDFRRICLWGCHRCSPGLPQSPMPLHV